MKERFRCWAGDICWSTRNQQMVSLLVRLLRIYGYYVSQSKTKQISLNFIFPWKINDYFVCVSPLDNCLFGIYRCIHSGWCRIRSSSVQRYTATNFRLKFQLSSNGKSSVSIVSNAYTLALARWAYSSLCACVTECICLTIVETEWNALHNHTFSACSQRCMKLIQHIVQTNL